jgi:hypothetical protein
VTAGQINENRRLESETYSLELQIGAGRHHLDVCIARDKEDQVREVNFVSRGKIGGGLDLLLHELGIQVSRCIQRRSPITGMPIS